MKDGAVMAGMTILRTTGAVVMGRRALLNAGLTSCMWMSRPSCSAEVCACSRILARLVSSWSR